MENRHTFLSWLTAIALVFLLSLGHAGGLAAAELIKLGVEHEHGIYTVRLEMELDVAADHVQRVLTNYDQLHRLNPSIVESRLLSSPDDEVVRVFTRMKSCVLFFCSGFTRVEDVYRSASGDLLAVIVPGQSDFKAGTARWHITARGDRTLLVYEANMQPDFFIPPLIGSYLVKDVLRDKLLVSFNRTDCCRGRD
ncbi:MAG: hypothetical protein ABFS22_13015 [Pseudomonadota bacterium]